MKGRSGLFEWELYDMALAKHLTTANRGYRSLYRVLSHACVGTPERACMQLKKCAGGSRGAVVRERHWEPEQKGCTLVHSTYSQYITTGNVCKINNNNNPPPSPPWPIT